MQRVNVPIFSRLLASALALPACVLPCHAQAAHRQVPSAVVGPINPVVPFGYGINIHETQFPPAEYKLYHAAGFGLIRTDFHWQDVENTAGTYDFNKYDAQLAQLDVMGVRPLWVLSYGNTNYDGGLPPHTEEGLKAFANFAGAAAAHFRGRGVLWEIWNEPNQPIFWPPKPDADQYAALVKATVPAIRAADPQATILAGAISTFDLPYVEGFLRHRPLDGVTAFSIHPYRDGPPESVISDYAAVRALVARYTPPGRKPPPVVCSEWGYTTATDQTTEADQGLYVVRTYLANLLSGVDLTISYDWTDDGADPANNESRYGILRQDLTPKPAYTAITAFTTKLRGYQFRHRLRSKDGSDYRLLFQGQNGLATVTWTSDDMASAAAQTPRITMIGKGDARYAALLPLARAKSSPYDLPYPDVLPKIPGIVTVLTSTSAPQAPKAGGAASVPTAGDQVLVNGGFEAGDTGWSALFLDPGQRLGITNAITHSGGRSAFMSAQPGTAPSWFNWAQTVSAVVPGDQYTFTAWVKKEDVRGIAGWYVHVNGTGGMLYNNVLTNGTGYSTWKKVSVSFTIPPGGSSITLGTSLYGTGVAYFDDASLSRTGHVP